MELIAASRIVRAQTRIAANRPYREGMERILRLTAAADPAAAKRLLGTPESPATWGSSPSSVTVAWPGSYNSGVLRATERLVAEHRARRRRGDAVDGGQEGPALLPLPRHRDGAVLRGLRRPPRVRRRPRVAAVVAAPFVAGEIDLVQMVSTRFISAGTQRVETLQMLPLPLPEEDEERAGRRPRTGSSRATPSSSPSRRSCWSSWRPGRLRPRSSPPCSRARHRSSPPSSGPWPPPPTTPTSWSAP